MAFSLAKAFVSVDADLQPLDSGLKEAKGKVSRATAAMNRKAAKRRATAIRATKQTGAVVGAAVAGALALMTREALQFHSEFATVATLGVKDLDALKQGALDVATAYGVDAQKQVANIYNIISAGLPEDAAILVLEQAARGAIAGVGELSDAVDLGTSLMNAFSLQGKNANETAANMAQIMGEAATAVKFGKTTIADLGQAVGKAASIMAVAGISTKEYLSSIAALTTTGQPAVEQVTGLKQAVSNIIKPTERAKEVADQLGVQFDAAALKAKGLVGFLDSITEAIERQMTPVQKRREAIEKEIATLETSLDSNRSISSQIRKLKDEYEELASGGHGRRRQALQEEIAAMQQHGVRTLEEKRTLAELKAEYQSLSQEGIARRLTEIDQEVNGLESARSKNLEAKDAITALKKEYSSLSEGAIKVRLRDIEREEEATRKEIKLKAKLGEGFSDQQQQLKDLRKERDFLTGAEQDSLATVGKLFDSTEALNIVLSLTGEQRKPYEDAMAGMAAALQNLTEMEQAAIDSDPTFVLRQMREEAREVAIRLGEKLIPSLDKVGKVLIPIIARISDWIAENPELTKQIVAVAAGVVVLSASMVVLGPLIAAAPWILLAGVIAGVATAGWKFGSWVDAMIDKIPGLNSILNALFDKLVSSFEVFQKFFGFIDDDFALGEGSERHVRRGAFLDQGTLKNQLDSVVSSPGGAGGALTSAAPGGVGAVSNSVTIGSVTISIQAGPGEGGASLGRRAAREFIDTVRFGLNEPGALAAMAT